MASAPLLPYQQKILTQLTSPEPESDGLLLLARGLGIRTILCAFLETFMEEQSLVVVVNATSEEEKGMADELGTRLTVLGFNVSAKDRQTAYKRGGVLSVTSQILIIDMLNERIPVSEMTGIVVLHAENVSPTSQEAFLMRVYREKNKHGFIKAFSDEPEAFRAGVGPLQTVLTQLHIRHVFLYPRFHEMVNADLTKKKSDVLTLHQPLSESMDTIQTAIIECLDATLAELKRSNTTIEVEDLTVENALFRAFDTKIRMQLDPQWHKLKPSTRGLVHDLTALRSLLGYLLSFDSVSFYQYLQTVLKDATEWANGEKKENPNPWTTLPAADVIVQTARGRVYKKVAVQPDKEESAPPAAAKKNGSAVPQAQREQTEDAYWDDANDSIFDDPAILAATQSSSVNAASGSITQPTEDEDNAAEMFRTAPAPSSNGKGKGRAVDQDLPEDFYNSRRKEPWAYWCPEGSVPVLEEQPKWFLLREILAEIENDLHWKPVDFDNPSNDTILIMCESTRTVNTLRKYLSGIPDLDRDEDGKDGNSGGRDLLTARAGEMFLWTATMGAIKKNQKAAVQSNAIRTVGQPYKPAVTTAANGAVVEYESAALKRKSAYKHGQAINKRRRVRGGGAAGSAGTSRPGSRTSGAGGASTSATAFEQEAEELAAKFAEDTLAGTDGILPNSLQDPDEDFDPVAFNEYFGLLEPEQTIVIRAYSGDEDDRILQELRPRFVILYDPDTSYVRRIEAYRAAYPGLKVSTYFFVYANSAEEQRYLSSIRREREAFEKLIRERSSMAIALQADRRPNEDRADDFLRTVNTRIAGGGKHARSDPPRVVVDVREFRSSLPSLLHAAGFIVVPLTLTIGDYVLAPDMAVERKSLPDLIQSFNSGRLYQQCEVMTTHYTVPILLIEFDQKKSFSLETYSDKGGGGLAKEYARDQMDTDLHSKLVLLTITFPKLRIIWSSSAYATADIFAELKQNRDEPDAGQAAAVGAEEGGGAGAEGEAEVAINQTPQELLRSLPGITSKNYSHFMKQDEVQNFETLTRLELEDMNKHLGVEAGRQLHTFVNHSLLKPNAISEGKEKSAAVAVEEEEEEDNTDVGL